jgi:uncharacterized GH25 family protein
MKKLSHTQKILLPLLLAAVYLTCTSHFIWIETQADATPGKEQAIQLYYGEYADNLIEKAGNKLEEVNGLSAFYLDPNLKMNELRLNKISDGYITKFTPSTTGLFQVLAINNVREVVDFSKYDIGVVRPIYYSRVHVLSKDKAGKINLPEIAPYHDLDILPVYKSNGITFNPNEMMELKVYFRQKGLAKAKLHVFAPNGWMKELDCDENGLASYTPLWKGQYLVECIYKERTPGQFMNRNYEAIRHRSILTILVK